MAVRLRKPGRVEPGNGTLIKYGKRQWKALIGACLLQCAMLGILVNCTGVFLAQLRMENGIPMTEISAYNTLKGIVGALLSALVTGLFFKRNQKYALIINQTVMCIGYLLMVFQPYGMAWYISAAVVGVSGCLGVVAVPSMLSRVFPQRSGTPTGIAMAFSGIGGAVFNPLTARLIAAAGLRRAMAILCLVDLLFTLVGALLLFPGGKKDTAETVRTVKWERKGTFAWKRCIPVAMVFVCGSLGFQMAMNLSIFAQSKGYPLSTGASLTMALMLGNVAGKFLYGFLCDRIGVWKTTALGLGFVAAGTLIFLLFGQNLGPLYFAALLFGSIYSLSTISVSRCCMEAYGEETYSHYIGLHNGLNQAVMAIASMMTGVIVDRTGSFSLVLLSVLAGTMLSLAGVWILRRIGNGKTVIPTERPM